MRYFLELSYNGTRYHGWQKQPHAASVQETVEQALSTLFQKQIEIVAAGRTDAGVHAKQIFAHVDLSDEIDLSNFPYRLNALLPNDIAITSLVPVKDDAHARFDAISRSYEYHLNIGKNPFAQNFAYQVYHKPNVNLMNQAAEHLFAYSDFQCFSKSKTDVKTYICKLKEAHWKANGNELIFHITADRFLRNMVRAIVGTLLDIGYQKMNVEEIHTIIKSKDRSRAGTSVPAQGLYLTKVTYPKDIYL